MSPSSAYLHGLENRAGGAGDAFYAGGQHPGVDPKEYQTLAGLLVHCAGRLYLDRPDSRLKPGVQRSNLLPDVYL